MKTLVEWLAWWGGLGRLPKSPGTFGTLGAIPLVFLFVALGPLPYMIGTLVFILVAVFVAQAYENIHGEHDSSSIVIDEVAGFLVAMTWVPLNLKFIGAGFFLFRLFDIWKPGPIGELDRRVKGGLGVVLDDVAAGLLVNLLLQAWLGRFAL